MSDLNERLDQALHTIEPGQAPVEEAMARGRKIRHRHRAAVLAGSVAVIAAAVVSVPMFARQQALPGPSAGHVRVTVNRPGPHAPAGEIAAGLIGTQPWDLRVQSPGTGNCAITGLNLPYFACNGNGLPQADAADPIGFGGAGGTYTASGGRTEAFAVTYGVLRADVTSVRVLLADGTVLTPRPVTLDGMRWVAFANPASVPIAGLTAYSRTGEIATTIPFTAPDGTGPSFAAWLRPGEAGPARVTMEIESGTADGQAWRLTAYVGPWGTCVTGGDGQVCDPGTTPIKTGIALLGNLGVGPTAQMVWGTVAESVSYLIVTPKGGTPIHVGVTTVGQQKFFGCPVSHQPEKGDRWTAYNRSGKPIASGSFTYSS